MLYSKESSTNIETGTPNEVALLYNLRALSGYPIGKQLAHYIAKHSYIDEIYLCGPPGGGKTIIGNQLNTELLKLQPDMTIHEIWFDKIRAKMMKEFAEQEPTLGNTANWKPEHWHQFSQRMSEEIAKPVVSSGRLLKKVELVGIGPRDQGVSTVTQAAEQKRNKEGQVTKLFIYMDPDPRIMPIAQSIRNFILNAPAGGLKSELLTRNFDVGEGFDDSELSGLQIKSIMDRMAKDWQIKRNHDDIMNDAEAWRHTSRDEYETISNSITLPTDVFGHQTEAIRKNRQDDMQYTDEEIWLLYGAYMQHLFEMWGLGSLEEGSLVLFNPLSREQIIANLAKLGM